MPPKKGKASTLAAAAAAEPPTLPLAKELSLTATHSAAIQCVGVDEAGRGPLAGPVVAAAVAVLDLSSSPVLGVRDSKTVDEEEREALFEKLVDCRQLVYGVSVIERDVIDEINILQATMKGMADAVEQVQAKLRALKRTHPLYVLIDGPKVPARIVSAVEEWWAAHEGTGSASSSSAGAGALPAPPAGIKCAEPVIAGDSKVYSIAAASLIAKVTRDRLMRAYDATYPLYGFAIHKGYGVPAHLAAIYKHGPCDIHRRSFRPVKDMVAKPAVLPASTADVTSRTGKPASRGRSTAAAKKAAAPSAPVADMKGADATDPPLKSGRKRKAAAAADTALAGGADSECVAAVEKRPRRAAAEATARARSLPRLAAPQASTGKRRS
jgi:ribonuclease HII